MQILNIHTIPLYRKKETVIDNIDFYTTTESRYNNSIPNARFLETVNVQNECGGILETTSIPPLSKVSYLLSYTKKHHHDVCVEVLYIFVKNEWIPYSMKVIGESTHKHYNDWFAIYTYTDYFYKEVWGVTIGSSFDHVLKNQIIQRSKKKYKNSIPNVEQAVTTACDFHHMCDDIKEMFLIDPECNDPQCLQVQDSFYNRIKELTTLTYSKEELYQWKEFSECTTSVVIPYAYPEICYKGDVIRYNYPYNMFPIMDQLSLLHCSDFDIFFSVTFDESNKPLNVEYEDTVTYHDYLRAYNCRPGCDQHEGNSCYFENDIKRLRSLLYDWLSVTDLSELHKVKSDFTVLRVIKTHMENYYIYIIRGTSVFMYYNNKAALLLIPATNRL